MFSFKKNPKAQANFHEKRKTTMATTAIPDSYESIRRVPSSETGIVSVETRETAPLRRSPGDRLPVWPRRIAPWAMVALFFAMAVHAAVGQEKVLYSFSFNTLGVGKDGAAPNGNLVFDTAGNLYGETSNGGSAADAGMIYELSPQAGGSWTEKIIYAFGDGGDGSGPYGGLIFDASGNLYGTASKGIFELSPQSGGLWTLQVLYTPSGETDASGPVNGLIFDKSGNLYGASESGGAYAAYGTVFELSPPQSGTGPWTEQILHSFNNNFVDGYRPLGSLVFDANGNLYGTTSYGGVNGMGTVFELTPGTGGVWTETILYSQSYAETPYANLIFDTEGNLYSTSFSGGAPGQNVGIHGTVFELSPPQSGTAWTEQILHSFAEDATDGGSPAAGLIFDAKGNLYSTTFHGGPFYTESDTANTDGTIFELLPQQTGGYAEDVLYIFGTATNDGVLPTAGVISDTKGNLYGETSEGGAYGYGAVFEYTPVPTTPMPVFSLNQGIYPSSQTVTVSDATEGAMLYCTIDGTTPTTSSPMCPASFTVSATETIQAIAVSTGLANSPVANATYMIEPPAATPIIYPDGGSFTTTAPMVSITDSTPGAKIYYSTTGGAPFTLYTFGFTLSSSETITAYAVANGYTQSLTTSATFNIDLATRLFLPMPGSKLTGSSATFRWAAGTNATSYALWLGSTGVGSNNIWGSSTTTGTSMTFGALPTNGETIYVRLFATVNGVLQHYDYTYIAVTQAALTSPSGGSTLTSPSATFVWSAATPSTGVTGYDLWLGTNGVGSNNLWGTGLTTETSVTFDALPTNGEKIYARLFTYFSGGSGYADYVYTAATPAQLTSPSPNSTFTGASETFMWTSVSSASQYSIWVGTSVGSNNLGYTLGGTTATSYTLNTLPTNGEKIYVRLWTNYPGGGLAHIDYTFTAAP
jgi:uncharacterized repeat protein (TIGR03803 family)